MSPEAIERASYNLAKAIVDSGDRDVSPELLKHFKRVIQWVGVADGEVISFAHKIVEAGR